METEASYDVRPSVLVYLCQKKERKTRLPLKIWQYYLKYYNYTQSCIIIP